MNVADCGICDGIKSIAKKFQKAAFQGGIIRPDAYEPFPPPPNADDLGRQTWTFLHTMAAYYPERPTIQQERHAHALFSAMAALYPCHVCAEHLQDELQVHPPKTDSRRSLSQWLCEMHNEVNERLGKPIFDCSRVLERWRLDRKAVTGSDQHK
jgi:FAD-linked sulfhydryl oxidase